MKILLLEDDLILSDIIRENLKLSGFEVILALDGEIAIEEIENQRFDLFIFDINVPKLSGIDLLKELRDYCNTTPTILITAYQDIQHLTDGFNAGCDDYIKKPFEYEELEQRILNLKRKFNIETIEYKKFTEDIYFNFEKHEIKIHDQTTYISQKESEILRYFYNNISRTVSINEIMQNIWIYDELPTEATLRVYIKNLRHIIGREYIQTIRGSGYIFEP